MNLYCRLIRYDRFSAEYAVGENTKHLDGIVRFYADETIPVILKKWSNFSPYWSRNIYSIDRKYRDRLSRIDFPEKMSWEVG